MYWKGKRDNAHFCRWEKWAWQSRRFTQWRWYQYIFIYHVQVRPFFEVEVKPFFFLFLRSRWDQGDKPFLMKIERCFVKWLWLFVIVIFGYVWKRSFHCKGEASRVLAVTTLVQSSAYGAIVVTPTHHLHGHHCQHGCNQNYQQAMESGRRSMSRSTSRNMNRSVSR